MRGLELLHKDAQTAAQRLVIICKEQGLGVSITETLRTAEEQDALYAKGRTEAGAIVTNARGSDYSSLHQWGVAFDFCRNEQGRAAFDNSDGFFDKVGKAGKNIGGLSWGGDWKSPDKPHFQLARYSPDGTAAYLKAAFKTPAEFIKTWASGTALLNALSVNGTNKEVIFTVQQLPFAVNGELHSDIATIIHNDNRYIKVQDLNKFKGLSAQWKPEKGYTELTFKATTCP